MNEQAILELNRLLWDKGRLADYAGDPEITVVQPGSYDPAAGVFRSAEVMVGGCLCRGAVVFTLPDAPPCYCGDAVLQVVSRPAGRVCLDGEREVYQVVVAPPRDVSDYYMRIRSGSGGDPDSLCGALLASFDPAVRTHFLDRLFLDRARRKCDELAALWKEGGRDWNYVLYAGLLASMGGSLYKQAYKELARRVPYLAVAREKNSREAVEALLIGGAGLLEKRGNDPYTVALKRHYEHLSHKYAIEPMAEGAWNLSDHGRYTSPVLRLVQIAGVLCTREFIFDSVRACRTPQDVYDLFRAEVPDYWMDQFASQGRIGKEKMDLMAINLVVPLQLAYADETRDEELHDAARGLIDRIAPESNAKLRVWRRRGVPMSSACDSQALLELHNEYCQKTRCAECSLCRRLIGEFCHTKP